MSAAILSPPGLEPGSARRMWPGGPLRRWSPARTSGCDMPLDRGGYGGSYVCEGCMQPVPGVYRVFRGVQRRETWLCGGCKAKAIARNISRK